MAKARPAVKQKAHRRDRRDEAGDSNVVEFGNRRTKKRSEGSSVHAPANTRKRVQCLNEAQGQYYLLLGSKPFTFGLGPAGTGKTHVAVGKGCELLQDNEIQQIVVTRPAVGASETMGYLPGNEEEKFAPFFRPVRAILDKFFGSNAVDCMIKNEKIIVMPLEFIRGTTFDNAFMIMDEAQNCTEEEMYAFLTRKGRNTTVVLNGDIEQIDIKAQSGLVHAIRLFEDSKNFGKYTFEIEDIVRDDDIKEVILAYRNDRIKRNPPQ